jgi:hypothetical protein
VAGKINIKLRYSEALLAAVVGIIRQLEDLLKDRIPTQGATAFDCWGYHIGGAMGEMAVAKWLNVFWSGKLGILTPGDVGDFEVRTRSGDWHDLIIYEKDLSNSKFIHVTGHKFVYTIHGWIYGHEGQKKEYWSDPTKKNRWAFFVPQANLRDLDTLHQDEDSNNQPHQTNLFGD